MISIALLLYELADGRLTGMSLMAGVRFEKEWVILLFGWIAFFYLWWRYRLRARGTWSLIRRDWNNFVHGNPSYKSLASKLKEKVENPKFVVQATPFIVRSWFSRGFDYSRDADGTMFGAKKLEGNLPAPFWKVLMIESRATYATIVHQAAATDYALPQVIAGGTLIVGIGLNVDSIFHWVAHLWK